MRIMASCHGKLRALYVWNNGRLLSQLALAVCAGSKTLNNADTTLKHTYSHEEVTVKTTKNYAINMAVFP